MAFKTNKGWACTKIRKGLSSDLNRLEILLVTMDGDGVMERCRLDLDVVAWTGLWYMLDND